MAQSKGLYLEVSMPEHEITAYTDSRAVGQILLNLTSNAIKFTNTGGVEIRLTGSADEHGRNVEFAVQDSGIGIHPDDHPKLFKAFAQIEAQQHPEIEGTGLGLYLCKQLAQALGGAITFRSAPGVGSTFVLRLTAE